MVDTTQEEGISFVAARESANEYLEDVANENVYILIYIYIY